MGVPVGAAKTAPAAKADTVKMSLASLSGVGVALLVIVVTLRVILLFVNVTVAAFLVASLVLSTFPKPTAAPVPGTQSALPLASLAKS